ncbi:MAG: sigma-70 family RNA polymerase sigma factor [Jatrophihabitans sp.]|nr:MAG: sigma-70 family RNA polymerase sigma factor [Jatrophihabitans sp.]
MTLTREPVLAEFEAHRRELSGYCYRMLGSAADTDDAVQETMIRSWQAADRFEGRSSVRSWLYRIATNVCLDMLRARRRRAAPTELGPAMPPVQSSLTGVLPEGSWVSPIADERVLPPEADPAEVSELRESVRLAFVAALQHLPPRQRAVLILCEVLRWQAAEVAALLDTSVAAVNSALQRARTTLAGAPTMLRPALDLDTTDLLEQYIAAFESYDIDRFVSLLHADAVQSMPPFAMWLRGREDIGAWMRGVGSGCEGSRLLPVAANGCPAVGQYRRADQGRPHDPAATGYLPWGLHVLDVVDGQIAEIHTFLAGHDVPGSDPGLFARFGLPARLPA